MFRFKVVEQLKAQTDGKVWRNKKNQRRTGVFRRF